MPGELKPLQDIMTCQRHSRPTASGPGFQRSVLFQQNLQAAVYASFPFSLSPHLLFTSLSHKKQILSGKHSYLVNALHHPISWIILQWRPSSIPSGPFLNYDRLLDLKPKPKPHHPYVTLHFCAASFNGTFFLCMTYYFFLDLTLSVSRC